MNQKPNILFLMTDQMQGRVLDPGHPCQIPAFRSLLEKGVRIRRAYTPNPVCSPARASLMTGVLPHTHGMLSVTHTMPEYYSQFQTQLPHWAQHLSAAGYSTGYFGKWHVERSEDLSKFGWKHHVLSESPAFKEKERQIRAGLPQEKEILSGRITSSVEGYTPGHLYSVIEEASGRRSVNIVSSFASEFLKSALTQNDPWCCFVSCEEPHDPFIATQDVFQKYDVDSLPLPENGNDSLENRPGLYRKSARGFSSMSQKQKREAAACYYSSITQVDCAYGKILKQIEDAGQLDNTIVVLTSDHGELLGAHGLYMKNVGAFEEVYEIPLVISGPGIEKGKVTEARVGLHEVGPTLLDLCGVSPIETQGQSQSFARLLKNSAASVADFQTGYAEYFGTRFWITQRVIWEGPWKLVLNGFDEDELYHLEKDPSELTNLIGEVSVREVMRRLMAKMWEKIKATNDFPLLKSDYLPLRLAPYGPEIGSDNLQNNSTS